MFRTDSTIFKMWYLNVFFNNKNKWEQFKLILNYLKENIILKFVFHISQHPTSCNKKNVFSEEHKKIFCIHICNVGTRVRKTRTFHAQHHHNIIYIPFFARTQHASSQIHLSVKIKDCAHQKSHRALVFVNAPPPLGSLSIVRDQTNKWLIRYFN